MSARKSVRRSVIILGLTLIPINTWWLIQMEEFRYAGHPTTASLFFNVIFILLLLTLLNLIIKRIFPKAAFSRAEFLTIYVMLSVASAIAGHDQLIGMPPATGHPFHFATVENEWETLFFKYIPEWLAVADKGVLRDYHQGESSLYISENFRAWVGPLAWWSLFYFVILFIILCINCIFRKQWIEREKLSYPVVQLPLAMTKGGTFWKNKLLWIGIAVAGSIDVVNGLHFIFPAIPEIPIRQRDIGHFFTEKPLNAIGWLPISFYPFAIGLCFFAPLDLTFSAWFFTSSGKPRELLAELWDGRISRAFPSTMSRFLGRRWSYSSLL